MMITRIVQNDHHLPLSGAITEKMIQKRAESLPVELFPLLGHQPPLPQMNGPIQSDLLMGRSLPEDRVFDLGRNPHHIPRSVLLKMALIQTPKVKIFSSQEAPEFFYMPADPPDSPLRSLPEAYVAEIPDDEKAVDIVVPRSLTQIPSLNGGTTESHPIVPENIQKRWEASVNRPLIASVDEDLTKSAALSPQHPPVPLTLLPGTDETNTGWSEESAPIDDPLHMCSFPDRERAIHEGDDHSGIPETSKFPVEAPILRPLDHQKLAFPWHPPFWVTMVTQNLIMRN